MKRYFNFVADSFRRASPDKVTTQDTNPCGICTYKNRGRGHCPERDGHRPQSPAAIAPLPPLGCHHEVAAATEGSAFAAPGDCGLAGAAEGVI